MLRKRVKTGLYVANTGKANGQACDRIPAEPSASAQVQLLIDTVARGNIPIWTNEKNNRNHLYLPPPC